MELLSYEHPYKAEGFFFVPVSVTEELIGLGRCSDMDALLDLWLHAVYKDERVQGSELGGVVYYRNGSGSPVLSYSQLGERWSVSKATVCRILNKLYHRGYLVVMSFSGRSGSAIYLSGYLSTMFQLSDTELDKQEVALALALVVDTGEALISVSDEQNSVSILHGGDLLAKVARSLGAHGFPCFRCKGSEYKLYELSGGSGKASSSPLRCMLEFKCQWGDQAYRFEITQLREGEADHE